MQGLLDHLERRIDGSIRGGATLGHLEQLAGHLELHAYDLLTFLLQKGDPSFKDVVVRRVEYFEALRNPSHEMWRQPGVFAFNVKARSEEHTSELQSLRHLVCRLLLEKKTK